MVLYAGFRESFDPQLASKEFINTGIEVEASEFVRWRLKDLSN